MIHICIDCRFHTKSGIGRYIREIVSRLVKHYSLDRCFTLLVDTSDVDNGFISSCNVDNVNFIECNSKMYSIYEQLELPMKIPPCDIFWSMHYNAPILPIRAKKKIVTIYDMAHLALADQLSFFQRIYARVLMYVSTHFYNEILTISNFTKSEIIKYESIEKSKIHIITCGSPNTSNYNKCISHDDKEIIKKKYKLPDRYLLFVGNVKPHKNLKTLISALKLLKKDRDFNNVSLVIVGRRDGFIHGDTGLVFDDKDIVFTGYVEDSDLPVIYAAAEIFIFPSLYEGFGIPPLEAMAAGTPVICSGVASMPEVCGDAAVYVNPLSVAEIKEKIVYVLNRDNKVQDMIREGYGNIKRYSWDMSSRQVSELMRCISIA